jgi:hypothetical protein
MKSFRRFSLGYFVALAAAVLLSASAQAETRHNRAVVRSIHGSGAQVSNNKGQSWQNAKVGQFLGANSVIKTSTDTTVDLFLGDNGPVVRVTPDTSMGIDKLDLDNTGIERVIETQLDLRNGRILGSVKKMAAASKYEVKTPVGVAGIRGTEYSIDARGRVSIITGAAVVVYVINGNILAPVNVGAGQTVTPPASPRDNPVIQPTAGNGDPTLLQGIGPDRATLQTGEPIIVVNGIPQPPAGGAAPPTTETIAPSPEIVVLPNPENIQGENEVRLSPTSTTPGA